MVDTIRKRIIDKEIEFKEAAFNFSHEKETRNNGGKLINPIIIDRIQDSEGNTIFNNDKRKCTNCDQISYLTNDYHQIINNYK